MEKTRPDVPDVGISLDGLIEAFAELLKSGDDPYGNEALEPPPAAQKLERLVGAPLAEPPAPDPCPITPRSILEAVLFVGNADNRPIASTEIASQMRGVRAAELDLLIRELNDAYASENRPYRIASVGTGYRMTLEPQFDAVREQFYGKARQARLSQAAIEVLALVAYNQPLSGDDVSRLRGTPSGHVLSQLVRRELLSLTREPGKRSKGKYNTTPRFLKLFGLASLDDLPRSQQLDLEMLS